MSNEIVGNNNGDAGCTFACESFKDVLRVLNGKVPSELPLFEENLKGFDGMLEVLDTTWKKCFSKITFADDFHAVITAAEPNTLDAGIVLDLINDSNPKNVLTLTYLVDLDEPYHIHVWYNDAEYYESSKNAEYLLKRQEAYVDFWRLFDATKGRKMGF